MSDTCELRRANGIEGRLCESGDCIYWRVVEHAGLPQVPEGCAIQHFELLDGGTEVAQWLLSVKERLEGPRHDA